MPKAKHFLNFTENFNVLVPFRFESKLKQVDLPFSIIKLPENEAKQLEIPDFHFGGKVTNGKIPSNPHPTFLLKLTQTIFLRSD